MQTNCVHFKVSSLLWVILGLLLYEGLSRAGVVATVVSLLGVVQARVVMSLEVHLEG